MCLRLDGEDFETVGSIATRFGGKIRCGKQEGGQVGAGMVCAGLWDTATKISIDTDHRPLHQYNSTHYTKPIQLMLVDFSKCVPADKKKLAAHLDLSGYTVARGNWERISKT